VWNPRPLRVPWSNWLSNIVSRTAPGVKPRADRTFLRSKSNPAILEIGKFGSTPTLEDLHTLTFEDRDLDDMRECVVGDCQFKLSSAMIDRFHKEVNLQSSDYRMQATQVLKQMLLEYVRDYQVRGDAALPGRLRSRSSTVVPFQP